MPLQAMMRSRAFGFSQPPMNDEITQRLISADFNGDYGRKFVLGDMGAFRIAFPNDVMNSILKTICHNAIKQYNIQHQSNITNFRVKDWKH